MALTKYKEGSLKELCVIAFPLMLSSLSVLAMIFVDRWLLAQYSTEALNAAVTATTLGWAIAIGWMSMASISEVFVAQFNGAGQLKRLGEPVWQMIWLSLLSIFCFVPLALFGPDLIFGAGPERQMEKDYFLWMMLFGPSYPIYSALCGFYVGQGKTFLVTSIAIIANIINAVLDWMLIFGVPDVIPSLGISGAAIATSGSTIFQSAILFAIFLSKKNREAHNTANYSLQLDTLMQCIKVGLPNASFVVLELLGWASFYAMMFSVSTTHITIAGICQSILILFFFFGDGINKAITAIAGNFIGANQRDKIVQSVFAGFKLHLIFFAVLMTIFVFAGDFITRQFLAQTPAEEVPALMETLFPVMIGSVVYLLFEGFRLLYAGALTAAGDTFFLLVSGTLSIWLCMVLPVYIFVVQKGASMEVAILIWIFYSGLLSLIYGWRFAQGKWKDVPVLVTNNDF